MTEMRTAPRSTKRMACSKCGVHGTEDRPVYVCYDPLDPGIDSDMPHYTRPLRLCHDVCGALEGMWPEIAYPADYGVGDTEPTPRAAVAAHTAWNDCRELLDRIREGLDGWEPELNTTNWGVAGSLDHFRARLTDVLDQVRREGEYR